MKAAELRIGNYVNYKHKGVIKLYAGDIPKVYVDQLERGDKYSSIPLTEEWLKKFGFESWYNNPGINCQKKVNIINPDLTVDHVKHFRLWKKDKSDEFEYWPGGYDSEEINDFLVKFTCVHQLQNLYFALTGEELSLTSSPHSGSSHI